MLVSELKAYLSNAPISIKEFEEQCSVPAKTIWYWLNDDRGLPEKHTQAVIKQAILLGWQPTSGNIQATVQGWELKTGNIIRHFASLSELVRWYDANEPHPVIFHTLRAEIEKALQQSPEETKQLLNSYL